MKIEKRKRRITKCYFNRFLSKFEHLLKKIIWQECNVNPEEYLSIAYGELLYVMIHFDQFTYPQTKRGSFCSYLYFRVSGVLKHVIQRELKYTGTELFDNFAVKDNLPIEEILENLNSIEKSIINEYYVGRKTLQELKSEMGISTGTIIKYRKRAVRKIRGV